MSLVEECGHSTLGAGLPKASTERFEELFQQSLNLSNDPSEEVVIHESRLIPETAHPEQHRAQIKYSISQHYTHTVSNFSNLYLSSDSSTTLRS